MPVCLLHPDREATAECEYCAQPHCGQCLKPLLGRNYCPDCIQRVRAISEGRRPGAAQPVSVPQGSGAPAPDGPTPRHRLPGWASALIYLLFFVAVIAVGQVIGMLPTLWARNLAAPGKGAGLTQLDPLSPGGLPIPLWAALLGVFTWVPFLMVLVYTGMTARLLERRRLSDLGLGWSRSIGRDLGVGLLMAATLFVSVVGIGTGRGWFSIDVASTLPNALVTAVVGFVILLPAAATEELSIRGFFLQTAERSWGRPVAVIASSIVFAGLHSLNGHFWDTPLAPAGLLLAGLYLASAYLVTESLWLPIFLHTGWNLMEGPVFGMRVSGLTIPVSVFQTNPTGPVHWTGGSFGPEASLLLCLLIVLHIAALWAIRPWLRPSKVEPAAPSKPTRVYHAVPVSHDAR